MEVVGGEVVGEEGDVGEQEVCGFEVCLPQVSWTSMCSVHPG